jgi:hypothetical protein
MGAEPYRKAAAMSFFTDAWVMCVGARSQARHGDMPGVIDTLEALERCLREWKAAAEQGESAPTDAQQTNGGASLNG